MRSYFSAMAAAAFAAALLMPCAANAGASASAPSKYAQVHRTNQQQAGRETYPISEYSSSARRHPQH
jgi:hypothetical protein